MKNQSLFLGVCTISTKMNGRLLFISFLLQIFLWFLSKDCSREKQGQKIKHRVYP